MARGEDATATDLFNVPPEMPYNGDCLCEGLLVKIIDQSRRFGLVSPVCCTWRAAAETVKKDFMAMLAGNWCCRSEQRVVEDEADWTTESIIHLEADGTFTSFFHEVLYIHIYPSSLGNSRAGCY